ncbi:hypothetical protein ILUMI_14493 [Ignelater luminosus]|uniref:PiggyBac transposable element-derived protein domain-containing protein n=1 Tax=Ignelater luminosus TaxID=2038154 RepID=A0A8K0CQE0_IGNLU|nr:hypothetical protein ILUMI_14493 [Ignelater luminosus]
MVKKRIPLYVRGIPSDNEDSVLEDDDVATKAPENFCNLNSEVNEDDGFSSDDDIILSHYFIDNNIPTTSAGTSASTQQKSNSSKTNKKQKRNTALPEKIMNLTTLYKLFKLFFPDCFMQQIIDMTELYSAQTRPNKPITTSISEMERFFGILLWMSLIKQNSSRNYWSSATRTPQIAEVISVNRFEELKRFLHFSNNEELQKKTDKIQPLLDQIKTIAHKILQEQYLSVDEQIIPYP